MRNKVAHCARRYTGGKFPPCVVRLYSPSELYGGMAARPRLGKRPLKDRPGPFVSTAAKCVNGDEAGEYPRGSIRRLKLHNFLTFDDVEIRPSPHLNVIVGPNGTGKSSIVCGICLALGGHTGILGRAKELKDYVKHGTQEGYVEIELHNDRGRNPVIRRYISRSEKGSVWTLHGKTVPAKEVIKQVKDLHIRLENKCQFLPQDMVVEFAKMNSFQLLEETEKAIGEDLYQKHQELKTMKTDQTTAERKLESKRSELVEEERRNQLLERDVERFRNFQEFQRKIKLLKMKKCWVEYQASRDEFMEVKSKRKSAERRLRSLKNEYQPIKDKHRQQEEAIKKLKDSEQTLSQSLRRLHRQLEGKHQEVLNLEGELDGPRQELEHKKKEEQERRKKIHKNQQEIQGFKNELESLESPDSIHPLITERNSRIREIGQQLMEYETQQERIIMEKQQYDDQVRRSEDELRRMQDVRNQRMEHIRRMDRETHDTILWLRDNQQRFKQPIIEPVMLLVNVKDRRYAAQVEAFLSGKDALSFIAQNPEDHETFLSEVRDKQRKRINAVKAPGHPLSCYQSALSLEQLRGYGFHHMLMDVMEAPEPTLCFFCQYYGLHQIPVTDNLTPPQIDRIINELRPIRRFFTSRSQISVKHPKYGNKINTRDSELRPPRILATSVDSQKKEELERAISEATRSLRVFEQEYKDLQRKTQTLRQEDNRLRQEKNDLREKILSRKRIMTNISSRETKLQQLQSRSFDLKAEEEKCEEAVERIQQQRVDCVCHIGEKIKECVKATEEKEKATLLSRGCELRVNFLLSQYHQARTNMENAEQEMTALKDSAQRLKDQATRLLKKAQDASGVSSPEDNPELMEAFMSLPNTQDTIEEQIHECQAQADLCMGTDRQVVAEFEERVKKIDALKEEIETMEESIKDRESSVDEIKRSWLEPLGELLKKVDEKFKCYFETMKCAGEIHLQKGEDFSKYGVDVRVMFRKGEALHKLNAQRQSGGERSVATMLYLMSLQGITSCPFRVVDEINQGMDPENERRVFDLIVKSASSGGNEQSQYFVLTPKLLRDLSYSESTTVHVVSNGQEMLPYNKCDIGRFLE